MKKSYNEKLKPNEKTALQNLLKRNEYYESGGLESSGHPEVKAYKLEKDSDGVSVFSVSDRGNSSMYYISNNSDDEHFNEVVETWDVDLPKSYKKDSDTFEYSDSFKKKMKKNPYYKK